MVGIFNKYKKICIILLSVMAVSLFGIYLRCLFMPGFHYGDAFLYKQEDGSFKGSDFYAQYRMNVMPAEYGSDIEFFVNDISKKYVIKHNGSDFERDVTITEKENIIFQGKALRLKDGWILQRENYEMPDEIKVYSDGYIPDETELFPGYSNLYYWAFAEKPETRGEPFMLFFIMLFGLVLFLDIKFPKLFWILEHRLDVYGGEPSDWYLFGQKIGRVVMAGGIIVCMVLSFTVN